MSVNRPSIGTIVRITADNTTFHGQDGIVTEVDDTGVGVRFDGNDQGYWFTHAEYIPSFRNARGALSGHASELPEGTIRRIRDNADTQTSGYSAGDWLAADHAGQVRGGTVSRHDDAPREPRRPATDLSCETCGAPFGDDCECPSVFTVGWERVMRGPHE